MKRRAFIKLGGQVTVANAHALMTQAYEKSSYNLLSVEGLMGRDGVDGNILLR